MISNFQKRIYNTHLITTRKAAGQPFRVRENFEKLSESDSLLLERLERFFKEFPQINLADFFSAPYKVFRDESYLPLQFFTTPKAKKLYAQYMRELELIDPDFPESIERFKDGLRYIFEYCKAHHLTFEDYVIYIEDTLPIFIDHLKKHNITYYNMHAIFDKYPQVDSSILDLAFGDFSIMYMKTKNKFFHSKKLLEYSKKSRAVLNDALKKNKISAGNAG